MSAGAADPGRDVPAAAPEETVEELYEDAPCGYLSTLADGTIVRLNRTFESWTGHRRADLVGAVRFQDLLSPGGRIYHETHYRPLLQMQGFVREIAFELVCADGRRLPVLVNSTVRRDADGHPSLVRVVAFDASDRRAYEVELLRARRQAERLQRHNALLAEAGRVLDVERGVTRRAAALVDLLAGELAAGTVLVLAGDSGPAASAGSVGESELPDAAAAALRSGRPEVRTGTGDEPPRVIAVPLVVEGSTLGALALSPPATGDGYGEEDLPLLEALADRAAVALANAQLYERERAVALTLQRAMLSGAPPSDPRCAIASYYSAAVETLEVGGDFHDALRVAPDRIVLAVGDVVGKGLAAAAAMGQVRSALRALAVAGLSPHAILEKLDPLVEHTEGLRGATIALVDLELRDGTLRLACAGHPPPIRLPPDGSPELLWEGRSGPLGTRRLTEGRDEAMLRLAPGTRVLLYSDGVVERRDRPIDRGIERLMEAFARRRGEALGSVPESLGAELLPEQHGADDVCLLAFAFDGAGSRP